MKLEPISKSSRLKSIDALRGIAVIGIIFVNILSMLFIRESNSAKIYEGIDSVLNLMYDMFIEIKLYSVFAFLFGMGYWMIYKRAVDANQKPNAILIKRSIVLLIIGLIHFIFLWNGDILFTYGLIALLLPLFIKLPNKSLVIWSISLLSIGVIAAFIVQSSVSSSPNTSEIITNYKPFKDYWHYVEVRATSDLISRLSTVIVYLFDILPIFLLGIMAAKIKLFEKAQEYNKKINKILYCSVVIAIVTSVPIVMNYLKSPEYNVYEVVGFLFLSSKFLACVYILLFIKLYNYNVLQKVFNLFSNTGKMSLTTYLSQTVITLIFFALLYENTVNITIWETFIYSIVLIVIQIIANNIWMKYFEMGPVEKLWRRLTYKK